MWMRCAVADRATASTANVFSESRGGHEVSILKRVAGLCRGAAPRSNTSMMIMRPPQHGQGCESGSSCQAADGLAPAERLLDALSLLLANRVVREPRGAGVDARAARWMWRVVGLRGNWRWRRPGWKWRGELKEWGTGPFPTPLSILETVVAPSAVSRALKIFRRVFRLKLTGRGQPPARLTSPISVACPASC